MHLPLPTELNSCCLPVLESLRTPHQAQRNETLWLKAARRKEEALGRGVALEGLQVNQEEPGDWQHQDRLWALGHGEAQKSGRNPIRSTEKWQPEGYTQPVTLPKDLGWSECNLW